MWLLGRIRGNFLEKLPKRKDQHFGHLQKAYLELLGSGQNVGSFSLANIKFEKSPIFKKNVYFRKNRLASKTQGLQN